MSLRSDLEDLRLKLVQLRGRPAGLQPELMDAIDALVERMSRDAAMRDRQALQGRLTQRWQNIVLVLGGLAALTTMVWRWPDLRRPPAVVDRAAPPPAVPPPACPPVVDAQSLDAVLDALAKARGAAGASRAATLSVGLLGDLVRGLMAAGTVSAEAGGRLLKDLEAEAVRRGGEIAVEAAKALIERYIRPHDAQQPPGSEIRAAPAGAAVNVYCGLAPAPVVVRPAPPPARPGPKRCAPPRPPAAQACPETAASAAG